MQANYFDPFASWKSLYTEMEPKISEGMQKWLESEEYASISGQLLSTTLQTGQMFLKTFEQLMQTYNIPTIKDIARLSELLIAVESKIDDAHERLDRLEKLALRTDEVRDELNAIGGQLEALSKVLNFEEAVAGKKDPTPRRSRRAAKIEESQEEAVPGEEQE